MSQQYQVWPILDDSKAKLDFQQLDKCEITNSKPTLYFLFIEAM